jgi:2-desacetyl-2-hydroxyethyl bacteriochlorophyllide A dehydrogenase
MGTSVRAVVIQAPDRVELREVPAPEIGPDDVLVKSHTVGICRTDLNILRGKLPSPIVTYPCIPGHEWSGTIADLGHNVKDLSLGDRVVCEGRIPCGRCFYCRAGDTNLCTNYDQIGFTRPGGCAELVAVPRQVAHRLPDHISSESAVLVEPASCVLRGLERAQLRVGESVGIVGIGTLGSIALTLVKLRSPRAMVAFGLRPDELAFALDSGADLSVDVSSRNLEKETASLVADGLDLVIEAAGGVAAIDVATRVVRPGGRVVVLGSAGEGARLDIPADRLMRKDLMVIGNLSYTSASWSNMLDMLVGGNVRMEHLVTHRFPLQDFAGALRLMERPVGRVTKVVLEHAR